MVYLILISFKFLVSKYDLIWKIFSYYNSEKIGSKV